MKYQNYLLICLIIILCANPVQAGIFKLISAPIKYTAKVIKSTGRFGVEVGAGVTAAMVYAKISEESVKIDSKYITLSESIYIKDVHGYRMEIPAGRYRIHSRNGNTVTFETPGHSFSSVSMELT
jgi:hypothetical protein